MPGNELRLKGAWAHDLQVGVFNTFIWKLNEGLTDTVICIRKPKTSSANLTPGYVFTSSFIFPTIGTGRLANTIFFFTMATTSKLPLSASACSKSMSSSVFPAGGFTGDESGCCCWFEDDRIFWTYASGGGAFLERTPSGFAKLATLPSRRW